MATVGAHLMHTMVENMINAHHMYSYEEDENMTRVHHMYSYEEVENKIRVHQSHEESIRPIATYYYCFRPSPRRRLGQAVQYCARRRYTGSAFSPDIPGTVAPLQSTTFPRFLG
jgi:hypothetical protein